MYASNKILGHTSDTRKHISAIKSELFFFFKGGRHVRQRGQQSKLPINQVSRVSHNAIFKMKDRNEEKKGKSVGKK